MKEMWKPPKKLVMLVLVILLIYNLVTLWLVIWRVSWIDGWGIGGRWYDNLFVYSEESSFVTQMTNIDNNPQIIVEFYEFSNPASPYIPMWLAEWRMSATNEIQVGGVVFRRLDGNVQIVNTGEVVENGAEWNTSWHDLPKNLLIPWHLEKIEVDVNNEGVLYNIMSASYDNVFYENSNFLFLEVHIRHHQEISPWGPIHLVLVLGALIYVWKRWR